MPYVNRKYNPVFIKELTEEKRYIKYSIIMPYYMRIPQAHKTLQTFVELYKKRDDYEVIIVEDFKNVISGLQSKRLEVLVGLFSKDINIKLFQYPSLTYNCSALINYGAKKASGEYLILTSPECRHITNILKGFDEEIERDNGNKYIVCACEHVNFSGQHISWYQHSRNNNNNLHFCSMISKENFFNIGGFDSRYYMGKGYDDNDFLRTIVVNKITIINRDDLIVQHLKHYKDSGVFIARKTLRNKKLYEEKWGITSNSTFLTRFSFIIKLYLKNIFKKINHK